MVTVSVKVDDQDAVVVEEPDGEKVVYATSAGHSDDGEATALRVGRAGQRAGHRLLPLPRQSEVITHLSRPADGAHIHRRP
jgi:hypothetical protein